MLPFDKCRERDRNRNKARRMFLARQVPDKYLIFHADTADMNRIEPGILGMPHTLANQRGSALVEYGVIVALIVVACLVTIVTLTNLLQDPEDPERGLYRQVERPITDFGRISGD